MTINDIEEIRLIWNDPRYTSTFTYYYIYISMQKKKGHDWKTQCCKTITVKPWVL